MKKSKKQYVVVALIVVLLTIAAVYAALSETLTITGTASASGEFDVYFSSATIVDSGKASATNGAANITGDKLAVTITNVELSHPGDSRTVTAVVTNDSTVPVKLTDFTFKDDEGVNFVGTQHIDVAVTGNTIGTTIAADGGTTTITFVVEWPSTEESTSVSGESVDFIATFTYTQDV